MRFSRLGLYNVAVTRVPAVSRWSPSVRPSSRVLRLAATVQNESVPVLKDDVTSFERTRSVATRTHSPARTVYNTVLLYNPFSFRFRTTWPENTVQSFFSAPCRLYTAAAARRRTSSRALTFTPVSPRRRWTLKKIPRGKHSLWQRSWFNTRSCVF